MKNKVLKTISDNFISLMKKKPDSITPKELASKSHISYPTLAPILRGDRDFGVTKLIALAEALNTTPDNLLKGAFKEPASTFKETAEKPRYLISFITNVRLTRCNVYEISSGNSQTKSFPFSLYCTESVYHTTQLLKTAITEMCGNISLREVYLYISVLQYEHIGARKRLQEYAETEFGTFIMEPDWKALYSSLIGEKNAILLAINDGYVIAYSTDQGKTLYKFQGYGFPISDDAGNLWLGCEAIKHTVNAMEGLDKVTLLSDKIMSLVSNNLDLLAVEVFDRPKETYLEAGSILKELAHGESKAQEIINRSYENILKRIKLIDNITQQELPVLVAGDLAYLYEKCIDPDRLIKVNLVNETASFEYAKKCLLNKA